jgi:ABC-type multidrug transport system permease subunit
MCTGLMCVLFVVLSYVCYMCCFWKRVCHEDDGLGGHLHNFRYKFYKEMEKWLYMRLYSGYFRLML